MAAVNENKSSFGRGKSTKDSKKWGSWDSIGGGYKAVSRGGGGNQPIKRVTSLKVKRVNSQKSIGYVLEQYVIYSYQTCRLERFCSDI